MKIAIAGSAGVGKTTLATALADKYKALLVKEQYEIFFNKDGGFLKSDKVLSSRITEVLDLKHKQESTMERVVSDRCPVDLFNLWLSRGFARYQDETMALYKMCRSYVEKYDFIVVLPWGSIPLRQITDTGSKRVRVMNSWTQLHNHSSIIGLCHQWVLPRKLIPVPNHIKGHELRVDYVVRKVSMSGHLCV
ncbi:MAG: AAA family ATPase [Sedimenticola sp.]